MCQLIVNLLKVNQYFLQFDKKVFWLPLMTLLQTNFSLESSKIICGKMGWDTNIILYFGNYYNRLQQIANGKRDCIC